MFGKRRYPTLLTSACWVLAVGCGSPLPLEIVRPTDGLVIEDKKMEKMGSDSNFRAVPA